MTKGSPQNLEPAEFQNGALEEDVQIISLLRRQLRSIYTMLDGRAAEPKHYLVFCGMIKQVNDRGFFEGCHPQATELYKLLLEDLEDVEVFFEESLGKGVVGAIRQKTKKVLGLSVDPRKFTKNTMLTKFLVVTEEDPVDQRSTPKKQGLPAAETEKRLKPIPIKQFRKKAAQIRREIKVGSAGAIELLKELETDVQLFPKSFPEEKQKTIKKFKELLKNALEHKAASPKKQKKPSDSARGRAFARVRKTQRSHLDRHVTIKETNKKKVPPSRRRKA